MLKKPNHSKSDFLVLFQLFLHTAYQPPRLERIFSMLKIQTLSCSETSMVKKTCFEEKRTSFYEEGVATDVPILGMSWPYHLVESREAYLQTLEIDVHEGHVPWRKGGSAPGRGSRNSNSRRYF